MPVIRPICARGVVPVTKNRGRAVAVASPGPRYRTPAALMTTDVPKLKCLAACVVGSGGVSAGREIERCFVSREAGRGRGGTSGSEA